MAVNAPANAGFTQVFNIIDGFKGDKVVDPELVWLPSERELKTVRKILDI